MNKFRIAAVGLAVAALGGTLSAPALASSTTAAPTTLTAIRADHHLGYDRLVFEFTGKLPAERSARYVSTVFADPSGKVVPVSGSAKLLGSSSTFRPRTAPRRCTCSWPTLMGSRPESIRSRPGTGRR